jgi:hypothetical protein
MKEYFLLWFISPEMLMSFSLMMDEESRGLRGFFECLEVERSSSSSSELFDFRSLLLLILLILLMKKFLLLLLLM